jgi:hypothetical protein
MLVALVIAMAIVVSSPLAAAVLVSIASRREDRAQTLARCPGGPFRASARRVVGFRSDTSDRPGPPTPCRRGCDGAVVPAIASSHPRW